VDLTHLETAVELAFKLRHRRRGITASKAAMAIQKSYKDYP
jgi:hypothetical protein